MKKIALLTFLIPSFILSAQSITDTRDNKEYKIITIGSQTWMAENLAYETEGAVAYGEVDSNALKYGYLYDWETAQNSCPLGWMVPKEEDWNVLINKLGGKNMAGGKLKLKGTEKWKSPNRFGSDAIGFSALPGGALVEGEFLGFGESAYFWSSEAECTSAFIKFLTFKAGFADIKSLSKTDNASVRCIKK